MNGKGFSPPGKQTSEKTYFEIEGCLNIDNMSFYRIKNKPMPLKASSNAPIPKTDLVDKLIKQKR